MPKDLNDVYVDVALECYERVRRLQPGSEDAETAERAISMALSERRGQQDRDRLLGDVLRNGRFSVRRGTARHLQAVQESGELAQRGIATGGTPGFVERETPETVCIANDLAEHLREEACTCGRHGTRVLRGLVEGETNEEISRAAGVSLATVNRTVRRLRGAADGYGARDAA